MNEKLIERKLREGVRKRGGLALKFTSPGFTGVPDRIVLMPGAQTWWPELKTTGKGLSPRQKFVKQQLESMGFRFRKIDSQETLDAFFNELDS